MPRSLPPSSRTSASTSNPAPPASFAKSVKNEIITCFPQLPRQHPPLAIDHQRRRGRQRPARNYAAQQRRLLPFPRHLEAQARFGRLATRNRTLAPRRRLRPNRPRSVQRHLSVTIRERRMNLSDTKFLTSAPPPLRSAIFATSRHPKNADCKPGTPRDLLLREPAKFPSGREGRIRGKSVSKVSFVSIRAFPSVMLEPLWTLPRAIDLLNLVYAALPSSLRRGWHARCGAPAGRPWSKRSEPRMLLKTQGVGKITCESRFGLKAMRAAAHCGLSLGLGGDAG